MLHVFRNLLIDLLETLFRGDNLFVCLDGFLDLFRTVPKLSLHVDCHEHLHRLFDPLPWHLHSLSLGQPMKQDKQALELLAHVYMDVVQLLSVHLCHLSVVNGSGGRLSTIHRDPPTSHLQLLSKLHDLLIPPVSKRLRSCKSSSFLHPEPASKIFARQQWAHKLKNLSQLKILLSAGSKLVNQLVHFEPQLHLLLNQNGENTHQFVLGDVLRL
mmetsp:Transcript_35123/g.76896  ORF Transcript_35123/g.76896 Transcript_35123/m.76896 type:complete len:214 (+) Transcript_35123:981-1622(+)